VEWPQISEGVVMEWRDVPDWEGLYQVSSEGDVRSVDRIVKGRHGPTQYMGRNLKPTFTTGYGNVTLVATGTGRREQCYVHDLVLRAFVGSKPKGLEVCHGPKGPWFNTLDNLRYDTRAANAADRFEFGNANTGSHKLRKPPRLVRCCICQCEFSIRRRKERPRHVCSDPRCRTELGRQVMTAFRQRQRDAKKG